MIAGIPWRSGDPHRQASLAYVLDHLHNAGVPRVLADSGHDPFSRAATRNRIAADQAGVVIFHDADMIIPAAAYEALADLAETSGRLVVGYTQYRPLQPRETAAVLAGADPWDQPLTAGDTKGWSRGGIFAITRDAWDHVGGMDERFTGWGMEDWAFAHACDITLGPLLRLDTPAVHLWHPHAEPTVGPGNAELMAAYTACTTVDELRAVQSQRAAA